MLSWDQRDLCLNMGSIPNVAGPKYIEHYQEGLGASQLLTHMLSINGGYLQNNHHILKTDVPYIIPPFGGFHKWGYPKIDGLYGKTLLKWMIWRYPHLWKPPLLENPICGNPISSHILRYGIAAKMRRPSARTALDSWPSRPGALHGTKKLSVQLGRGFKVYV